MTTTEPTNPRKLAQDALELAEKATEGKWAAEPSIYASGDNGRFVINRLPNSHLDEVLIAEMPYSAVRGKDAKENIANAKLMAASRQLVPDLAKALIAALDRNEQLEKKDRGKEVLEKVLELIEIQTETFKRLNASKLELEIMSAFYRVIKSQAKFILDEDSVDLED